MIPAAEQGGDNIENAIPVCFECHAEIHSYNDDHPRGRKFTAGELEGHKNEWLRLCKDQPEIMINTARNVEVGPLQALIDELEFNEAVARAESEGDMGCLFQLDQFHRAIEHGSISILMDEIRTSVIEVYRVMGSANTKINAIWLQAPGAGMKNAQAESRKLINESKKQIGPAKECLLAFLGTKKEA